MIVDISLKCYFTSLVQMSEQEKIVFDLLEYLKRKFLQFNATNLVENENIDKYTEKLTKNRYKLIYSMCQTVKVMDYLESQGAMPRSICSRILHESRVPEDRNRALIDFLQCRAKETFDVFLQALYLAGNEHLVILLDENFLLTPIRQQLDLEYRFSTVIGQSTKSIEDNKLRQFTEQFQSLEINVPPLPFEDDEMTKFDDEVQMGFEVQILGSDVLEKYPQLDPVKRTSKTYRMLSAPRGQCLLINNVDAFRTMETRQGSDVDASKLKSLFEQLGFTVIVRRNLSSQDMINVIKNFAQTIDEDAQASDASIVIVLSHGTNGKIYGVDELMVDIDEHIISVFDDHLIGKPKLFIFQACRGSQCNYRMDSTSELKTAWSSDSAVTDIDRNSLSITKTPKRSDMVIWYSTLKDYVSWRSPDAGSLFIQSLVTVFARTAWCYDLVTMAQCVNRTMKEKFTAHESMPFQTPCFEYHLDYPLYFNPGCYEHNQ